MRRSLGLVLGSAALLAAIWGYSVASAANDHSRMPPRPPGPPPSSSSSSSSSTLSGGALERHLDQLERDINAN